MRGTQHRTQHGTQQCTAMESKLIEYLDGNGTPAARRAVERHLAVCAGCRAHAEEFPAIWDALNDLPVLSPSPAFDASLRARIAAEPVRRRFWNWMPSPRIAFAVTALVVMSVWVSYAPRTATDPAPSDQISADADFGMIQDLPVLENYDVLSQFDALSELPVAQAADNDNGDVTVESSQ